MSDEDTQITADFLMTDADRLRFIRETVDDAARFRATLDVLVDYLRRFGVFIIEHYGWRVIWQNMATGEQRQLGQYPTYAQALDKALYEVERVLKAGGALSDDYDYRADYERGEVSVMRDTWTPEPTPQLRLYYWTTRTYEAAVVVLAYTKTQAMQLLLQAVSDEWKAVGIPEVEEWDVFELPMVVAAHVLET